MPPGLLDGSVLLLSLFWPKFLYSILYKVHVLYVHLVRTFLKCCSVLSSSGVEQTALLLCTGVLMTLYFAAIGCDRPVAGLMSMWWFCVYTY